MLKINAGAYSFGSRTRATSTSEKIWRDVPLPDGKVLIPGLLGHASNYVEHPELIADTTIELYAGIVGRGNVIAGADCGFSSRASFHSGGAPDGRVGEVPGLGRGRAAGVPAAMVIT